MEDFISQVTFIVLFWNVLKDDKVSGNDTTGASELTALTTQVHHKESTENKCKGDREEVCNMTFYKTWLLTNNQNEDEQDSAETS